MSELASNAGAAASPARAAQAAAEAAVARPERTWRVRDAAPDDVAAVAAAVGELLAELGAAPPPPQAMEAVSYALISGGQPGALLLAVADEPAGQLVGVLGATWQLAIHAAGRYALIQELWVQRDWRGHAIGAELLAALARRARRERIARVEVGLPRAGFPGLAATETFYRRNGFEPLGARMRWALP